MTEYYEFIDKSGHFYNDLARSDNGTGAMKLLSGWFKKHFRFDFDDLLCFREKMIGYGFEYGIDFDFVEVE